MAAKSQSSNLLVRLYHRFMICDLLFPNTLCSSAQLEKLLMLRQEPSSHAIFR